MSTQPTNNKPYTLLHGDCIEQMATLPDNSIDAIVTDPPYGLGFMGKEWDALPPGVEVFAECLRVLKPGGHIVAFGGSRTYHRMAVAVEDAGFEIRDQIMWVYGSGFPKSHNISKAIDKAAGAKRKVLGVKYRVGDHTKAIQRYGTRESGGTSSAMNTPAKDVLNSASATPKAKEWEGFGTAIKPAHEPIVLARKPLSEKTIAANVLKWGTGAINIDGCRVGTREKEQFTGKKDGTINTYGYYYEKSDKPLPEGRFPANLIHDGSPEVVALFPETGPSKLRHRGHAGYFASYADNGDCRGHEDNGGSAARFFYCAKASKRDRDEGLDEFEAKQSGMSNGAQLNGAGYDKGQGIGLNRVIPRKNTHTTVKPTKLMRYLCRLITPPGGTVLDPFTGSGSTGKAAIQESFTFVGCEKEQEYIDIAAARIEHVVHES